ncbi:MAG: DUF1501 domain-containing protein [Myxococcota bacterium]
MASRNSRRDLLKAAAGIGAGLMLGGLFPSRAQAAPQPRRRFLFAYFDGGWDLLLGLDPRNPATTNAQTHLIETGYGQLGARGQRGVRSVGALQFGPAVHPDFLQVASRCSVIQGVSMDTASHEVGRRYFLTGRFPRGITAVGSSTASEVVAQQGDLTPIPHLSVNVEAYATGLPSFASALSVGSLTDLFVALRPFSNLDPAIEAAVKSYQDGTGCAGTQADAKGLVTNLQRSIQRSRSYITSQLDRIFDLTRMDPEMDALRARYDTAAAGQDPTAPEILGFIGAQALKEGVSQAVSVRVANRLDTHGQDWASDQAPNQERGWKVLAAMLKDLSETPSKDAPGKTVLDETTVVAFSEFGRTPLFNSIRGRDHFVGNSVLVAGAGVKPGLVIGKSAEVGMMPVETDLMTGQGVDHATQEQKDSGAVQILTPKHVLATVLEAGGFDASYLRTPAIRALLA